MKITASLVYIVVLIVTGCQVAVSVIPSSSPTPVAEIPEDNPTGSSLIMTKDTGPQALIEKAKEDLAQRLGVSVDRVTVTAVIGQEFSTDAFYCRTSKERTAEEESPLVVSGHVVLLSVSERRYEYHVGDQMVVFCRPLL